MPIKLFEIETEIEIIVVLVVDVVVVSSPVVMDYQKSHFQSNICPCSEGQRAAVKLTVWHKSVAEL